MHRGTACVSVCVPVCVGIRAEKSTEEAVAEKRRRRKIAKFGGKQFRQAAKIQTVFSAAAPHFPFGRLLSPRLVCLLLPPCLRLSCLLLRCAPSRLTDGRTDAAKNDGTGWRYRRQVRKNWALLLCVSLRSLSPSPLLVGSGWGDCAVCV